MKLKDIINVIDAKVLCGEHLLETEVLSAYACDLMSDVLAFVENQCMLLTGLVNPQVVRTAEMMDMKAIVFVRGKEPDDEVLQLAKDAGIAVMATDLPMYISCGKLYGEGLKW
ncbi:MAG: hypothetical protein IJN62_04240 [Clostridia bacterium]|nr:hypothetical protein [Clostridia bacterium]